MKTYCSGHIVDPVNKRTFKGTIVIQDGSISEIREADEVPDQTILPGFVDAHIHIESSMLVPSEFARLAVRHGTVATVSDPHEIANVCGIEGVEYMIRNGNSVPLKFFFGAPSCVPATTFETAGATLDTEAIRELLKRDEILYLAEMMNWPGVLFDDAEVVAKIEAAHSVGKPVDGHAPGLKGDRARKYASAGITTDHECFTLEEAVDKIEAGMIISIREGSAAKNFDTLIPLFREYPDKIMFCSDDKHPDDLVKGHMNDIALRCLSHGFELYDILHALCVLPVKHYRLPVGLLQAGDPADFIVVKSSRSLEIMETWINGKQVYSNGELFFPETEAGRINQFCVYEVTSDEFRLFSDKAEQELIIARDGELITERETVTLPVLNGEVLPLPDEDILKIAVVNRYEKCPPAVGFIRNFGIKNGAIASSVGHDSHNIIVVGTSDQDLARAVNLIMNEEGGISAVSGENEDVLALPVAGIMSDAPGKEVAEGYERLTAMSREMGSTLKAPFMLISFMALLVIPSLKMSDKGLFDGELFRFVEQ